MSSALRPEGEISTQEKAAGMPCNKPEGSTASNIFSQHRRSKRRCMWSSILKPLHTNLTMQRVLA